MNFYGGLNKLCVVEKSKQVCINGDVPATCNNFERQYSIVRKKMSAIEKESFQEQWQTTAIIFYL